MGINNPIEAIYVIRWLISAAARSYEPGCKADAALILVGKEGLFKTTFFEVLAGKENFASLSGDVGDRKFLMVMRKNWIVELGEIDAAFRTNDWGRLKGFITNAVDKYVLPYGTKGLDFPRIGVLAGTTNYEKPLRDVNSEFRRYWCIRVERHIDTEWIAENRDSIWAAITHLYRGGMQWWLTPEEEEAHKSHALNFSAESSYFEKLLRLLPTSRTIKVAGKQVTIKWAEDSFLISDLCDALGVSGRSAEMGVGNDLRHLGFDKKQMRGYGGKTNYWYLADPDKMQVTALPELDMDNLLRQAD
jgi:predicted P-loop ATPase